MDPSGNALMVGTLEGTAVLRSPLQSVTSLGADIFVTKVSADGAPVWFTTFGGPGSDSGNSVACDSNGDAYITGSFEQTATFGTTTLTTASGSDGASHSDGFVMKVSGASGAPVWVEQFGSQLGASGQAVALDGNQTSLVVVGGYAGANVSGTLVMQLDASDGGQGWTRDFSGVSSLGVAFTLTESVVVVGRYTSALAIGGTALPSSGGTNAVVLGLDGHSGDALWVHGVAGGPADQQAASAVAVDPNSGRIVVTGVMEGTVDFGGGPVTSTGDADVFLLAFDSSGHYLWSRHFEGASDPEGGVAIDAAGNVVLVGSFEGTLNIGGQSLTAASTHPGRMFVAKLDPEGATAYWARSIGTTGQSHVAVPVVGPSAGSPYIAGDFDGTGGFGDTIYSVPGGDEYGFVARLTP